MAGLSLTVFLLAVFVWPDEYRNPDPDAEEDEVIFIFINFILFFFFFNHFLIIFFSGIYSCTTTGLYRADIYATDPLTSCSLCHEHCVLAVLARQQVASWLGGCFDRPAGLWNLHPGLERRVGPALAGGHGLGTGGALCGHSRHFRGIDEVLLAIRKRSHSIRSVHQILQ